jgi:uncharacterized protein YdeI (BOF family)
MDSSGFDITMTTYADKVVGFTGEVGGRTIDVRHPRDEDFTVGSFKYDRDNQWVIIDGNIMAFKNVVTREVSPWQTQL